MSSVFDKGGLEIWNKKKQRVVAHDALLVLVAGRPRICNSHTRLGSSVEDQVSRHDVSYLFRAQQQDAPQEEAASHRQYRQSSTRIVLRQSHKSCIQYWKWFARLRCDSNHIHELRVHS